VARGALWRKVDRFGFDEFKSGGLHEEHAVATGNHLGICLETEENQENLCRGCRSQDLPVTY
jgi:hypothetical protein